MQLLPLECFSEWLDFQEDFGGEGRVAGEHELEDCSKHKQQHESRSGVRSEQRRKRETTRDKGRVYGANGSVGD